MQGDINKDYIIVEVDTSYSLIVDRGDTIKMLKSTDIYKRGETFSVNSFSTDGSIIFFGGDISIPSNGYGATYIVVDIL